MDLTIIVSVAGGLKVWECTSDLLKYLSTSNFKQEFKGKTVLDLGCGAGVLGIFALLNGAQRVDFQDYVSLNLSKFL